MPDSISYGECANYGNFYCLNLQFLDTLIAELVLIYDFLHTNFDIKSFPCTHCHTQTLSYTDINLNINIFVKTKLNWYQLGVTPAEKHGVIFRIATLAYSLFEQSIIQLQQNCWIWM